MIVDAFTAFGACLAGLIVLALLFLANRTTH